MSRHIFPAHAHEPISREVLAIMSEVARRLDDDVIVSVYNEAPNMKVWSSFRCGDRDFAIWLRTNKLYEMDEIGAVGDDPIEVESL